MCIKKQTNILMAKDGFITKIGKLHVRRAFGNAKTTRNTREFNIALMK